MTQDHQDLENLESLDSLDQAADSAMGGDVTALMGQIEKLQRELADEKLKSAQATDMALRMKAEAENTRRRAAKDVEHAHKYGVEKIIKDLLAVLDSFDFGLASVANVTDETALSFVTAMKMTNKMLLDNLLSAGIVHINPLGQPFDPKIHEALSLQHTDEHAPDTVVTVLQPGFMLYERVLRPARVVVAKPVSGTN